MNYGAMTLNRESSIAVPTESRSSPKIASKLIQNIGIKATFRRLPPPNPVEADLFQPACSLNLSFASQ